MQERNARKERRSPFSKPFSFQQVQWRWRGDMSQQVCIIAPTPNNRSYPDCLHINHMAPGNKKKMILFNRAGGKKSGAFPSLDRNTDGGRSHPQARGGGAVVATPNYTEKPFNPVNIVIDTAETVTVSTVTNDRAFHSMKRFNCGIDYNDKNNTRSVDYIQESKNWYKSKKQNQTYLPLRDNGSAFTAPESSFGMSETNGTYNKKSRSKKWLGRYVAVKSLVWRWRCKDRWMREGSSGELAAATTGYSSVGSSRSRSGSEGSAQQLQEDEGGKGVLSAVRLTYCDDSGIREEKFVWDS